MSCRLRLQHITVFALVSFAWSCQHSSGGAVPKVDAEGGNGGSPTTSNGGGEGGQAQCTGPDDDSETCQAIRNKSCSQNSLDTCASDYCGPILGAKINEEQNCVETDPAPIACGIVLFGCTGAEILATSPNGDTWMLTGGCLPHGWSEAADDAVPDPCGAGSGGAGGSP
jgi:hypothetical protein